LAGLAKPENVGPNISHCIKTIFSDASGIGITEVTKSVSAFLNANQSKELFEKILDSPGVFYIIVPTLD